MKKTARDEFTVIGDFDLTQPVMRVTDPCYDREVWCCGTIDQCKVGTWEAGVFYNDVDDWDRRVSIIAIRHKDSGPAFTDIINRKAYSLHSNTCWQFQPFEVGVDSGQAGFFDEKFYQDDGVFENYPEPEHQFGERWYSHVCDITLSQIQGGVIPYGAVSSSGFGDGSYDCCTHEAASGEVDFAYITFIEAF